MHVRNPFLVAILVTINVVLAVPRPRPPASPENKESSVNVWPLMSLPLLGLPFFLPRPDPCITDALNTRAKNIEMFDKNVRHTSSEPWPEWYRTLTEVVRGCEAQYRRRGKAKKIDLTKSVYREMLEEGLAQCIKKERKGASRSIPTQDDRWWNEKQRIQRCKMWWTLDPPPETESNRSPNAGDRLNSVIQQAGDKFSRFVGTIVRATNGGPHPAQGSKPSGGLVVPGGMTGSGPAFAAP